jgi:hypothetical protein
VRGYGAGEEEAAVSEYDPSEDNLLVEAECSGVDKVKLRANWNSLGGAYVEVSAYEAFEIAGRVQAAAVRAMMGLDAPATYSPEELARIERLKRVIPL